MNKAQLIGHVGKDPEIRTTPGGKVASFSVATSEYWKDKKTGERKEKTEWHRIVVWSPGLVTLVEKHVKKGAKLFLEGPLATRKWTDKDGQEHQTTEIVLQGYNCAIELLDRKPADAGQPANDADEFEDSYDDLAADIRF